MKAREVWMLVHRWMGLIGLVLMVVFGITGSLLVWPEQTERWFHADRFQVSNGPAELPISAYEAAALSVLPAGERISAMQLPVSPGQPVLVGAAPHSSARVGPPPRRRAWLDPETGEVAATWGLAPDGMWYLHALHGHLAIPGGIGRAIVGWSGVLLFLSVVSGLWLWWPRNNNVLKAMRWRRAPSQMSNIHHSAGFWSAIPMAVLAITGSWIAFPAFFGGLVTILSGQLEIGEQAGRVSMPPATELLAAPALSVDDAAELARAQVAGSAVSFVGWPTEDQPVWAIRLSCPSASTDCIAEYRIADGTAEITALHPPDPDARSAAQVATEGADALHAGRLLGPIWSVLVFLAGFVLAALGVTGIVMWWRARGNRIRMKQLRQSRAAA